MKFSAVIVNYACHPTTLAWDNRAISPDWIGAMRENVEAAAGGICMFLQGASGGGGIVLAGGFAYGDYLREKGESIFARIRAGDFRPTPSEFACSDCPALDLVCAGPRLEASQWAQASA